ncbi:unnamed protein product, partial [Brenthis ino]
MRRELPNQGALVVRVEHRLQAALELAYRGVLVKVSAPAIPAVVLRVKVTSGEPQKRGGGVLASERALPPLSQFSRSGARTPHAVLARATRSQNFINEAGHARMYRLWAIWQPRH